MEHLKNVPTIHNFCMYNNRMKIVYDENKSATNLKERMLGFNQAADLDWSRALIAQDTRKEYPELRYIAIAPLAERLHVVVFTPIDGGIRIISFRKANTREVTHYEKATQ